MAEERKMSDYGMLLKHLRIDGKEMLKDMAGRLGLKSSYLSAIESGARDIPPDLTDRLCAEYGLDGAKRAELKEAELNAERKLVQIDMEKINGSRLAKEVVLNFAGKVTGLTDAQLNAINAVLNRTEKEAGL